MTDVQIYVGKLDLDALFECLENGLENATSFIGMEVDTYGSVNYFDTIQATVNIYGLTIFKDGEVELDAASIVDAYKSVCSKTIIIETEKDRYFFRQYTAPISKSE